MNVRRWIDMGVVSGAVVLALAALSVPFSLAVVRGESAISPALAGGGLLYGAGVWLCAWEVARRVATSGNARLFPFVPMEISLYYRMNLIEVLPVVAAVFALGPIAIAEGTREAARASAGHDPGPAFTVNFALAHVACFAVAAHEKLARGFWTRLFFAPRAILSVGPPGVARVAIPGTVAALALVDPPETGRIVAETMNRIAEGGLFGKAANLMLLPFAGLAAFHAPGSPAVDAWAASAILGGLALASAAGIAREWRELSMEKLDEAVFERWSAEREEMESVEIANLSEGVLLDEAELDATSANGSSADGGGTGAGPPGEDPFPGEDFSPVSPEAAYVRKLALWRRLPVFGWLSPWSVATLVAWTWWLGLGPASGLLAASDASRNEVGVAVGLLAFAWIACGARVAGLRFSDPCGATLPLRWGGLLRRLHRESFVSRLATDLVAAALPATVANDPLWIPLFVFWFQALRALAGMADALRGFAGAGRPLASQICGAVGFVGYGVAPGFWSIAFAGVDSPGTPGLAMAASTVPLLVAWAVCAASLAILRRRHGAQAVFSPDPSPVWNRILGRRL